MNQRSLTVFENGLKSKETIKSYKWYLKKFKEYYKLRDYDSMAQMDQKKVQIMIEDYTMDLKKRVNPNSVPSFVFPVKAFFEANDIDLKWNKIKKLFPANIKKTGRESWDTKQIQKMLQITKELRNQSIIHLLASTACRIGAIPDLKIRNVFQMPDECKAVLIYEDDKEEYFVFLTPEASLVLDQYLEQRRKDGEYLSPESPLFRTNYRIGIQKAEPMTKRALESVIGRIARKAGLRENKKAGRYPQQLDHAFRKRFSTILKLNEKIPVSITERLLGHQSYYDENNNKVQLDDAYLTAKKEQLFEKFKLAIPDLTINNIEREKAENARKQNRIDELEIKNDVIEEIQKNQAIMQETLNNISKIATRRDMPFTYKIDPKTGKKNVVSMDMDMDMFEAGGNVKKYEEIIKKKRNELRSLS